MSQLALAIVIPAYQPDHRLVEVARGIRNRGDLPIIIVDDGSSPDCGAVFDEVSRLSSVRVVRHAVNLGKGAALRTGINEALVSDPSVAGIVTVDADGQHEPDDVWRLVRAFENAPAALWLGVRVFSGAPARIPLRSAIGNRATRIVFRVLTGVPLQDTQTGLRAIPARLSRRMLQVTLNNYDFESEMLIVSRQEQCPIRELPIQTVYLAGNASSHFNPVRDSIRIYFVFLRFAFASIVTSLVDLCVFGVAFTFTSSLLASSACSRLVAGSFNFFFGRSVVFRSVQRAFPEAVRYFALVVVLMFASNAAIEALIERFGLGVYTAKIFVEVSFFLLSFSVQRLLVFPMAPPAAHAESTDWDAYYASSSRIAAFTRRITCRRIIKALDEALGPGRIGLTILEIGGGNSAFFGAIRDRFDPSSYAVVDRNQLGLSKFRETYPDEARVRLIQGDVLRMPEVLPAPDLVFSVGLIEHFDRAGTARAIESHFQAVAPGGVVLLTFPTPTFPYRVTRAAAELLGRWAFKDERPCTMAEIEAQVSRHGIVLHRSIIWPILLTQGMIVARKKAQGSP